MIQLNSSPDPILDREVTYEELQVVIQKMKNGKAPGEDRIPAEFIKNATPNFIEGIRTAFNAILTTGSVPESFQKNIIFPILKKGDDSDPRNFRGISFINALCKLFTSILQARLYQWTEHNRILTDFQAGFRKRFSTVDNIFILTNIAKRYLRRRKKLYLFFVDFKAAFDAIARFALFHKLRELGLSEKFTRVLISLYTNNLTTVWNGEEHAEWFQTNMGVKQGCQLSPLLFALFMNDLTDCLTGGITVAGVHIKALLYADDVVLFAESPFALQRMINQLGEYCRTWDLKINTEKSKIMIVRDGRGRYAANERWFMGGQELDIVQEYKYLGVLITSSMQLQKHFEWKLSRSKCAIHSNWKNLLAKKDVQPSVKYKLFQAVMRAIMCYAAEVWGIDERDEVEKLERYFIKRIFGLPENTPNYMIYLETGLPSTYTHTLNTHFNYIRKIMMLPDSRLIKRITVELLERKELFFKEWQDLANKHQIQILLDQPETWLRSHQMIVEAVDRDVTSKLAEKARASDVRLTYRILTYEMGEKNYFNDQHSKNEIATIFKTRGELLRRNYRPHIPQETELCTLCNLREREDILHFLAVCPILREIRIAHFSKVRLTQEEAVSYLNGQNWKALANYVKEALCYRNRIIEEFF